MLQILSRRNHPYPITSTLRKMLQIFSHQPSPRNLRQRQKRSILRVRTGNRPRRRLRKPQTLLNHKLKPKRRKPVPLKLLSSRNLAILGRNERTANQLHLPSYDPISDQFSGRPVSSDASRDNDIGIQHRQPHQAGTPSLAARCSRISASISDSLNSPISRAIRHPCRRLAIAIARRSSRSSSITSPNTGTKK